MKLRFEHPAWQRGAPILARVLVRLVLGTTRPVVHGHDQAIALVESGVPIIFAAWHCQLLAALYYARTYILPTLPMVVMASPSRDGEFIARVARGLGFVTIPGSRRKGGVQALQQMAGYMQRGYGAALAADGSRGPARTMQKGVLYLARETQAPILPVAVASFPKITLNTWDRFEVPLPFSRIVISAAAPLRVSSDHRGPRLEERRRDLEVCLNALFEGRQG